MEMDPTEKLVLKIREDVETILTTIDDLSVKLQLDTKEVVADDQSFKTLGLKGNDKFKPYRHEGTTDNRSW